MKARSDHLALLEGEDGQPGESFEEFAGAKQEIRVARTSKAFIADREGLINQHAVGRQGRGDRREQRAMEVIGHKDAVIEAELPQGMFRHAGFEIDGVDFALVAGERAQALDIAVDGSDPKPHIEQ